jgi:hypothetical protein
MNPTVASFRQGSSATGASAPRAATGGTCADAAVPGRGPGHCGTAPGGPWPATAPTPARGRTARGRSGGHPTGDAGGAARRSRPQPRRTGAWDCFAAGGSDPADRACPPARTAAASCAGSGARCRTGPRPHRSETRRALRGQPGSGTRPTAVHPRLRRKHPCRTGSWGIAGVQPNASVSLRTTGLRLPAAALPCPPMTDEAGAKHGSSARTPGRSQRRFSGEVAISSTATEACELRCFTNCELVPICIPRHASDQAFCAVGRE